MGKLVDALQIMIIYFLVSQKFKIMSKLVSGLFRLTDNFVQIKSGSHCVMRNFISYTWTNRKKRTKNCGPEKRLILRNQMPLKRSIYICSLKLAEFLKRFPFCRGSGNEKPNPWNRERAERPEIKRISTSNPSEPDNLHNYTCI